ncbi:MAG: sensor domain-containing diguanylate cyclase [Bacillota bacterium]|nr:sensor domain-containing diguanylate cyclase [Bacillota bacterium]MDI7250287.1 sensor domain-containing diguanylate cyclase [Bacillota bacterium]
MGAGLAPGYRIYAWLVGLAGIGAAVLFSWGHGLADPTALVLFVAMSSLAEFLDVRLPTGIRLSLSFAPVLPCFLLLGTAQAMWVNMLSSLLGNALPRRRPAFIAVFNLGQYALSCLAAGLVYRAVGGTMGPGRGAGGVMGPGALLLVLTYFMVNHLLVTWYAGWRDAGNLRSAPRKVLDVIRGSLGWDMLNYLVTIPVGVSMATAYSLQGPIWAAMVFVPVLAVAYILRLHLELQAAHRRLTVIQEVGRQLNATLERERVLDMLTGAIRRLVKCDVCAIFLKGGEDGVLHLARLDHPHPAAFPLSHLRPGEGELGRLLAERRAAVTSNAVSAGWLHVDPDDPAPPRGAAVVPLLMDGGLLGALWVSSAEARACSPQELQALEVLGTQAAVAVQNATLYRRAEELSVTDDLTGLYNHRYFTRQLQYAIGQCGSRGGTVALVYVDLDDLGNYNNTYGHVVGDALLREFGQTLRSAVREIDVPTRYGGDEFAVILAGASREEALAVAERIRARVEAHVFDGPDGPLRITASIGVAVFPEDAENVTDLVRVADQAMYVAKSEGGNRVVCPRARP